MEGILALYPIIFNFYNPPPLDGVPHCELHPSWIIWKIIDMHCWTFHGAPISWNLPFFPIIILDTAVSLKEFTNLKMIWFRLCSTDIFLDIGCWDVRYINRLTLGTILVMFVSPTFLEILWSIKTEEPMETEEGFLWIVYIPSYQCYLLPINSNTLEYTFNGLVLSSLLLNGWSSLIVVSISLILATASTPLYFNYRVLKFIIALRVDIYISTVLVFTLQIFMYCLYLI